MESGAIREHKTKNETVEKRKLFYCKPKNICLEETQAIQRTSKGSSSEEEHKVNALASGAEEGRDKLR